MTDFATVSDAIRAFQTNRDSFASPYDKDFGNCTSGHDLNDVAGQSDILIIGEHHSAQSLETLDHMLHAYNPDYLIAEISEIEGLPESFDQEKLNDMGIQVGGDSRYTRMINSAMESGAKIVLADADSEDVKAQILQERADVADSLNSRFSRAARAVWDSDYGVDSYMGIQDAMMERYERTDPNFADKALDSLQAEDGGTTFMYLGSHHAYNTERLINEQAEADNTNINVNTVHIVGVDEQAMDVLEDKGMLQVNGTYVMPFLDTSSEGLDMESFTKFIDSVPGNDPQQVLAANVIDTFYDDDIVPDDYSKDDLKKCAPASGANFTAKP